MFKDLIVRKDTPAAAPRKIFTPAVDVRESPEALTLWVDLPGADEKSVDVSIEGNALEITARGAEAAPEGRAAVWRESAPGDWRRRFVLALDAVNADGIKASYKDGVLQVVIPKAETAKRRRIAVQS